MVASGKGGTGKSTLSVLTGARLAAQGRRVLLIELDSGLRSVDIISGVCGKTVYDINDVLCGRCAGDKAIVDSPLYPGLSVISAPYEGGEIPPAALQRLMAELDTAFDFILLDTAAGMGPAFTAALHACNRALIVVTPDPVALRDGRIVSDALFTAGCPDIRLVVNRATPQSFGHGAPVEDLDECIDTVCAQLIAVIPESRALQQAAALGTALAPQDPAMAAADRLARRIQGQLCPLGLNFLKY